MMQLMTSGGIKAGGRQSMTRGLNDRTALTGAGTPAPAPAKPAVSSRRRTIMNFTFVFLLGLLAARLPATIAQVNAMAGGKADFEDPVLDVYRLLMGYAVKAPEQDKLQQGAIDGMLKSLDDDYAEYIPAQDEKEFEKQMTGAFVGIGCQIEIRDGWLTVVSPLEDSPALAAGIIANDRIAKIENESTFGLSSDECIKRLTGEPGTPVNIVIQREGAEIPMTIIRAKIVSKSVRGLNRIPEAHAQEPAATEPSASTNSRWNYLLDPDKKIAYIRMSQFTPTSPAEFRDAIGEARQSAGGEISGLIFDLRNNPGGYMDAALDIADMFIDKGKLMSIKGRDGKNETVFNAKSRGPHYTFPVVVLINQNSASASEIVSGALQDHDRAVVIGTRSFGKGLVQTVHHLPHDPDAQVKFTTQKYYLPSGRLIQRENDSTVWGVDPTPGFFIPMTDKEQIDLLLLRRDWDIIRTNGMKTREGETPAPPLADQHWTDPEWIKTTAKDPQLSAAVASFHTRLASGEWKPISDAKEQHGKIAMLELKQLERAREALGKDFARIDKRMEALEKAEQTGEVGPLAAKKLPDFWADTLDLTGGKVDVFDKEGKRIAELKITGRDLERWLAFADVKKEGEDNAPKDVSKANTSANTEPAKTP
jgi:carboxyl-terminal processing protease